MIFRRLTGYALSLILMPSQSLKSLPDSTDEGISTDRQLNIANSLIKSTKDASLDLWEVSASNKSIKDKKIIIHAVGNGDCYENHKAEFVSLAKRNPDYHVVGFNFRGTLKSTGYARSEDDWIDDAVAVVMHFHNQGVPYENILLNGQSLGAAILTMAAAKIYKTNQDEAKAKGLDPKAAQSVKLLNVRSFSTLTDEIIHSILGKIGSATLAGIIYGSIIGLGLGISLITPAILGSALLLCTNLITFKVTETLVRPLIQGFLYLSFGTMDAATAYKSLPEECVDHIVAKNDAVIKDPAGMHAALRENNRVKKTQYRKILLENNDAPSKAQALSDLLNIKDTKIKCDKKAANICGTEGMTAHNVSLQLMHTYHKARGHSGNEQIAGDEVLARKVKRLFKLN